MSVAEGRTQAPKVPVLDQCLSTLHVPLGFYVLVII